MLRALIYGLTILHLGPGLAFAVIAFGCDSDVTVLASLCQQDTFSAFLKLTLAIWAVLMTGLLCVIYINKNINNVD